jgi:hypothetical protein
MTLCEKKCHDTKRKALARNLCDDADGPDVRWDPLSKFDYDLIAIHGGVVTYGSNALGTGRVVVMDFIKFAQMLATTCFHCSRFRTSRGT